ERKVMVRTVCACCVIAMITACALGAAQSKLISLDRDGKLHYQPDANENTIPDFSNCGYMGGGVELPDVPVKATIEPSSSSKDDTDRIQKAIDQVSKASPGALLLKRGTYRIGGQLKINSSGVVLRGEGDGEDGTILV